MTTTTARKNLPSRTRDIRATTDAAQACFRSCDRAGHAELAISGPIARGYYLTDNPGSLSERLMMISFDYKATRLDLKTTEMIPNRRWIIYTATISWLIPSYHPSTGRSGTVHLYPPSPEQPSPSEQIGVSASRLLVKLFWAARLPLFQEERYDVTIGALPFWNPAAGWNSGDSPVDRVSRWS